MTTILAIILGAAWRYADGRGFGQTTVRNVVGLVIAVGAAYLGMGLTWQAGVCALLGWATLIIGRTDWSSWSSLARFGGPGCAIAVVGYLGGTPPLLAALYALACVLVGLAYTLLHRVNWKYSTRVCEALAGAVFIGGLAAL